MATATYCGGAAEWRSLELGTVDDRTGYAAKHGGNTTRKIIKRVVENHKQPAMVGSNGALRTLFVRYGDRLGAL